MIESLSRRVVGWSMVNHHRSELVTDALDMALGLRKPEEVIERRLFATKAEARLALFQYIKGFYNSWRGNSSLGYLLS